MEKLWRLSEDKHSRLVLALDLHGDKEHVLRKAKGLLDELRDYVVAVKVGYPLVLTMGLSSLEDLIEDHLDDYYFIADFKLADVPHTNEAICRLLKDHGLDAVIVHLFTMSIDKISEIMDVIGVLMMSHPTAVLFEKCFNELLDYGLRAGIKGVVIGATKPQYIKLARKVIGKKLTIFSPGIGPQGGVPGQALSEGADFEIVGRLIVRSEEPSREAMKIVEAQRKVIYG